MLQASDLFDPSKLSIMSTFYQSAASTLPKCFPVVDNVDNIKTISPYCPQ